MSNYTVYGRKRCDYCDKAKALLQEKGIDFKYFDIEEDDDVLEWFVAQGFTTVPQIFDKNLLVGGYTELETKLGNQRD